MPCRLQHCMRYIQENKWLFFVFITSFPCERLAPAAYIRSFGQTSSHAIASLLRHQFAGSRRRANPCTSKEEERLPKPCTPQNASNKRLSRHGIESLRHDHVVFVYNRSVYVAKPFRLLCSSSTHTITHHATWFER